MHTLLCIYAHGCTSRAQSRPGRALLSCSLHWHNRAPKQGWSTAAECRTCCHNSHKPSHLVSAHSYDTVTICSLLCRLLGIGVVSPNATMQGDSSSEVGSTGLRRRAQSDADSPIADQTSTSRAGQLAEETLDELKSAHSKQQHAALAARLNGAVAALDTVPEWPWIPLVLTVIAAFTRYWRLDRPPAVVFDEHHFGRFTNQYWKGEYFFDIHPPLGKT